LLLDGQLAGGQFAGRREAVEELLKDRRHERACREVRRRLRDVLLEQVRQGRLLGLGLQLRNGVGQLLRGRHLLEVSHEPAGDPPGQGLLRALDLVGELHPGRARGELPDPRGQLGRGGVAVEVGVVKRLHEAGIRVHAGHDLLHPQVGDVAGQAAQIEHFDLP
jgi:hypothetical protein